VYTFANVVSDLLVYIVYFSFSTVAAYMANEVVNVYIMSDVLTRSLHDALLRSMMLQLKHVAS